MIKWFIGVNAFLLIAYIQVLTINEYFEREKYKRTHFSCHYIQGICTVKVSWKNCSGGKPYDLCEKALNGLP